MSLTYDSIAAAQHLRAADPVLARAVDAVGPCTLQATGRPYDSLVRAILYQQLAGAAAATIERRFLALYGGVPTPEQLLATDVDTLRTAGVSRQKAGYLHDLARRAAEGIVSDALIALDDDEAARRVMLVKGIGRWTADMLLIFCLGRPDVLPTGDLGVKNAVQRLYGHEAHLSPAALVELAEPWRPFRSAAAWYLWQYLDVVTPRGSA